MCERDRVVCGEMMMVVGGQEVVVEHKEAPLRKL